MCTYDLGASIILSYAPGIIPLACDPDINWPFENRVIALQEWLQNSFKCLRKHHQ